MTSLVEVLSDDGVRSRIEVNTAVEAYLALLERNNNICAAKVKDLFVKLATTPTQRYSFVIGPKQLKEFRDIR